MNIKKTIKAMSMAVLVGCSLPAHAMTPVQITSNASTDAEPQIHGKQLVWQGKVNNNWEIFYHDISTGMTTQLTNNTVDDMFPQTDGSYVTWMTDGVMSYCTIATGLTEVIPEGTGDFIKTAPQIANGNITWAASSVSGSVDPGDIYLYNIASGVTTNISALTDPGNLLEDMGPRINDRLVGWVQVEEQGNDDPEDDVETFMLYDIGTATAAAAPYGFIWTESPQRDGNLRVLSKDDGNDREIFLQRRMTSIQVTDNTLNDSWPRISGITITWASGSGEAAEIYIATDTDSDGDGVTDSFDNCVNASNSDQLDTDSDGVGDVCEKFPLRHISNSNLPLLLISAVRAAQNAISRKMASKLLAAEACETPGP